MSILGRGAIVGSRIAAQNVSKWSRPVFKQTELVSIVTPATLYQPIRQPSAGSYRHFSSIPQLTPAQAIQSSEEILTALRSPQSIQQLESIRSSGADMLFKWQQANAALIPPTLQAITKLGYSADQQGLQAYTEAMSSIPKDSEEAAQLAGLMRTKWELLLEHGFGAGLGRAITLTEARAIATDIVDAMQDSTFLAEVDALFTGLMARLSITEKQQALLRVLINLQQEQMGKHGFPGEAGYAQCQISMLDHASDAIVTGAVMTCTQMVFTRAGLSLTELQG